MRGLLSATLMGVVALAVLGAAEPVLAKPPNVVVILADDLGFSDLASYGSEIPTPNIDALAASGLRLTNYHTAASCAPTRGMLLTGVDSHRNGVPNIVEAIPPSQAVHPNYRGALSHDVVTIATLLRDAGYHTYMTGKWHLGHQPDELPSRRGFERTIAMADTGADNWEKRPYLPIYEQANWYGDGEEIDLPEDFYSSRFFIDKTIEFIESNRADGQPFFSYIPFQAVHIPVQAPAEFTAKYRGQYDGGWDELRRRRFARAVELGIVPASTELAEVSTTGDWSALDDERQRYESKRMAVYAGMIDAMDHHIGRLLTYLREIGEFENTVFVFTSDNGAEGSDVTDFPAGRLVQPIFLALTDYNVDFETLGTKGSFVNIGPSFASAAASPLAYYKFFSREGGMRVPMILSGPGVREGGQISNAFAYVTDIAPTILEVAGVARPQGSYQGRTVEPMVGRSLLPLATGEVERVHDPEATVGYELAGNGALFQGDFKIVKDRGPVGDDEWHLFNIVVDPGEAKDLREQLPERFVAMQQAYDVYVRDNGVLPVPQGYDQRQEVMRNGLRKRLRPHAPKALAVVLALLAAVVVIGRRRRR